MAGRHHVPALDGLRAVAVAAVMAYHLNLAGSRGGYLGVDVFFVLSGFLITSLLVDEQARTTRINLLGFWARRARRLFPALFLLLGALSLYVALGGPGINVGTFRGDALATLFYVANWHLIAVHSSYFAQFSAPSPLEHAWSLGIEEQFYIVWPLLLLAFAKAGGQRRRAVAMASTAVLAVASAIDMAVMACGATNVSRAYYGTDARAFELMVGALLAFILSGARRATPDQARRAGRAGMVAAAAVAVGCVTLGGPPRWMFDGGFLAFDVLVAVVIVSIAWAGHGVVNTVLSTRPLRWVGRISYGLYLWHWPVIVVLSAQSTGLRPWLVDVVRVALTFTLATVSYYVVEQPIRHHGLPGWRRLLAPAAVLATAGAIVMATVPGAVAGASARRWPRRM